MSVGRSHDIVCVCVCVRSITTVDTCKTDSCARTRLRARSAMASSELSVRSNMWLLRALSIHCCCLENQAQISFTDRSAVSIFCVSKADGAGHRSWQHSHPSLPLLPPANVTKLREAVVGGRGRESRRPPAPDQETVAYCQQGLRPSHPHCCLCPPLSPPIDLVQYYERVKPEGMRALDRHPKM